MCACGNPERTGLDHSRHVCSSAGFFTPEDFASIERAAAKEEVEEA